MNGHMKKTFGFIALASMLALSGCGNADSNAATNSEGNATDSFPEKAVTMVVPFAAGGGTDATARALANATEEYLSGSITVENKTGGGGAVGLTAGATAAADGYTVTMATMELTTLKHLNVSDLTYEDFKPVAMINFDPPAITVKADAPYDTVEEFLAYAKENPKEIQVGNSGTGALWHLAAEIIGQSADVEFTHVPFEGAGPAVTALLGGHIDMVPVSPAEVKAHVESGALKTLAVVDDQPSEVLPDVQTLEEQTGIETPYIGSWRGIVVPKDTPQEVVDLLETAFTKGANDEKFVSFMKDNGLGLNVQDAASFQRTLEENHQYFGDLIPTLEGLK